MTNCSVLQKTLDKKDFAPKVARWALFLQEFDYEIVHRPETQMEHVNALRRNTMLVVTRSYDALTAKLKIAQQRDEHIQKLRKMIYQNILLDIFYISTKTTELLMIPTKSKKN